MIAEMAVCVLLRAAAGDVLVLRGGTVHTLSGDPVSDAVVVIEDGRIREVGRDVEIPHGARVEEIPAAAHVTAGLFDAYTHAGLEFERDEVTFAVTPHLRAVDGFLSDHPDVARARAAGVTMLAISPGDGNVIGGGVSLVRGARGTVLDMAAEPVAALKMNFGPEALEPRDREPTSPAGALRMVEAAFRSEQSEVFRILGAERRPALIRVPSLADVHRAARFLRDSGIAAIALDPPPDADDDLLRGFRGVVLRAPAPYDDERALAMPARLVRAGIPVAFGTAAPTTGPGWLRRGAALAVRCGMPREAALRAITRTPAELYGVSDRFGTIQPGREADIVVWSGDPLDLRSTVLHVIVAGRKVAP